MNAILSALKFLNPRVGSPEERALRTCSQGSLPCEVVVCVPDVLQWGSATFLNPGNDSLQYRHIFCVPACGYSYTNNFSQEAFQLFEFHFLTCMVDGKALPKM